VQVFQHTELSEMLKDHSTKRETNLHRSPRTVTIPVAKRRMVRWAGHEARMRRSQKAVAWKIEDRSLTGQLNSSAASMERIWYQRKGLYVVSISLGPLLI